MSTIYDDFMDSLEKYQYHFLTECHPNLWQDTVQGYRTLNTDAFRVYAHRNCTDKNRLGALWTCLKEYCDIFQIRDICMENRFKRLRFASVAPVKANDANYLSYAHFRKNLAAHIENKEGFRYDWNGHYVISAFGNMVGENYHAYMTVSRRINPYVDTYYIINDVATLFMETD